MKRRALFAALILGAAALASAQGWGRGMGRGGRPPVNVEAVNLTGALTIAQGAIAVKDGNTTYIVAGLHHLVGFIDGLKEGARVNLEGQAITSPQDSTVKYLRPAKMTFNGKTYDLARPAPLVPLNHRGGHFGRRR
jgi:hypothetical protein